MPTYFPTTLMHIWAMTSSFMRFLDHTKRRITYSVELPWKSDQLVAGTSTWQHTTLTTDRPLPDNRRHSQQTDLYLTTHNTHNRQTSSWQHTTLTTDRPLPENTQHSQQTDLYLTTHNTHNRQTSTWQHTTLTTDKPSCHGEIRNQNLSRRSAADVRLRKRGQ